MKKFFELMLLMISILILISLTLSNVIAYEIYYYNLDILGSPVVITDANANVVWRADYMPFGQSFNEVGKNDYKYNSKQLDKSGLFYYGARYYDAELGRFTSADTVKGDIKNPQSLNRYVYTLNNPLKYIDPSGNREIPALTPDYKGPFEFTKEEAGNLYVAAMTGGRIKEMKGMSTIQHSINFYYKLNKFNYGNPDIFVLTSLDISRGFSDDPETLRRTEAFQSLVSEKVTVGAGMGDVTIRRSDLSVGAENKEVALTLLHEAFEAEYVSEESLQALRSYLNTEERISSFERQLKVPMWADERKAIKSELIVQKGLLDVYKSEYERAVKIEMNRNDAFERKFDASIGGGG